MTIRFIFSAQHRGMASVPLIERYFVGSGIKVTATTIHKLAVFACLNDLERIGNWQERSCSEKEF
jgi:hypothetical protein